MTQQRALDARRTRRCIVVIERSATVGAGHPWIYRSDVVTRPDAPAGAVAVHDERGRELGCALWSPTSEIALRLLDRDPRATLDEAWWRERSAAAIARRASLSDKHQRLPARPWRRRRLSLA